jgi:hypothetical protein
MPRYGVDLQWLFSKRAAPRGPDERVPTPWPPGGSTSSGCPRLPALERRRRPVPAGRARPGAHRPDAGRLPGARQAVIRRTVAAIRTRTPHRPLVIDGLDGGTLAMPELADLGVTHSVRGYQPMNVSHYQAPWWPGHVGLPQPTYPCRYDGFRWDRDACGTSTARGGRWRRWGCPCTSGSSAATTRCRTTWPGPGSRSVRGLRGVRLGVRALGVRGPFRPCRPCPARSRLRGDARFPCRPQPARPDAVDQGVTKSRMPSARCTDHNLAHSRRHRTVAGCGRAAPRRARGPE